MARGEGTAAAILQAKFQKGNRKNQFNWTHNLSPNDSYLSIYAMSVEMHHLNEVLDVFLFSYWLCGRQKKKKKQISLNSTNYFSELSKAPL